MIKLIKFKILANKTQILNNRISKEKHFSVKSERRKKCAINIKMHHKFKKQIKLSEIIFRVTHLKFLNMKKLQLQIIELRI
jgi:hypothetical protein